MDRKTYTGLTRQIVTIPAYSTTRIDFNDTKPNYFRVQNQGSTNIFAGTSHIPTATNYDFLIPKQGLKMYAEPYYRTTLYLLNQSGSAVTCNVLTFAAEFDPLTLALSEINLDLSATSLETSSVISGFSAALPSGVNTIGSVGVTNTDYAKEAKQKDYTSTLTNILTAIGNIPGGSDGGSTSSWSTANITSLLGYVDDLETLITTIKNGVHSVPNVTTAAGTFADATLVKMITNDGTADITLTIATGKTFVLKAGESITDLAVDGLTIAGSDFRCLYL